MSDRTVDPSQRLRVAIGLTALKFKPPEQSIQSYTLELKHHFRCSAPNTGSEECDAWRDRVVALEAELQTMRAAASSEHIEFLVLKSAASTSAQKKGKPPKKQRRMSDPKKAHVLGVFSAPSGSTPRSKRKKSPEPSASRPSSPSPRINCGLFSSLHALDAASAVVPTDTALVVAATIRCIDVLHGLLARATSPIAPEAPQNPTPREALNGIERTLPHVLCTAMSTLDGADVGPSNAAGLRWYADPTEDPAQGDTISALELVVGRVATSLLVPAIRAIVPCALAKTEHILSSSSSGGASADGADLLGLVGAALQALSDNPHIALYERVALEAVRALTSLIADQPSQRTPAQRIHRIARKDALHFLCDAVLLSLRRTVPTATPPGSAGEMLVLALETALGELALKLSARGGLDAVEEHRVLAVLERAWSIGRRVGNIGGGAEGGDERLEAGQSGVHGQDVDATMMDVDGEDRENDDQRRGSNTANGS